MSNLHVVATLMDEFARAENNAYYFEVRRLKQLLIEKERAIQRRNARISELEVEIRLADDRLENMMELNHLLEQHVLECPNARSLNRRTRRRISFRDTSSDSEHESIDV